jgi:hypothetical protein
MRRSKIMDEGILGLIAGSVIVIAMHIGVAWLRIHMLNKEIAYWRANKWK